MQLTYTVSQRSAVQTEGLHEAPTPMTRTPTNFERSMSRHLVTLALETEPEEYHVDDEVELPFDADKWSIQSYDVGQNDDEPFVDVRATYRTSVTGKKVVRENSRHPAEYEQHRVTITLYNRFWPSRNDGFGEHDVVIEQDGGAPSGPSRDYDGYENRL